MNFVFMSPISLFFSLGLIVRHSPMESQQAAANRASLFNGLCKLELKRTGQSVPHAPGDHLGMPIIVFCLNLFQFSVK